MQLESKFKYLTETTSHDVNAKQDGIDAYEARIGLQVTHLLLIFRLTLTSKGYTYWQGSVVGACRLTRHPTSRSVLTTEIQV